MNKADLRKAIEAIYDCAMLMMDNASYIQRELPNVEMPDVLRSRTARVCDCMINTKFDVVSGAFEIGDFLAPEIKESEIDWKLMSSRIDLLMEWLSEEIVKLHELVLALREDRKKNESHAGALILVEESAANVMFAYNLARTAVHALMGENG